MTYSTLHGPLQAGRISVCCMHLQITHYYSCCTCILHYITPHGADRRQAPPPLTSSIYYFPLLIPPCASCFPRRQCCTAHSTALILQWCHLELLSHIQPPHTHPPTHTNRPATRQVYGFLFVTSEHISLHVSSYCISYFSNNSIVYVRIDICSPLLKPLSPPPPSSPLHLSHVLPQAVPCVVCHLHQKIPLSMRDDFTAHSLYWTMSVFFKSIVRLCSLESSSFYSCSISLCSSHHWPCSLSRTHSRPVSRFLSLHLMNIKSNTYSECNKYHEISHTRLALALICNHPNNAFSTLDCATVWCYLDFLWLSFSCTRRLSELELPGISLFLFDGLETCYGPMRKRKVIILACCLAFITLFNPSVYCDVLYPGD